METRPSITPKEIKALIADDRLDQAVDAMLSVTEEQGLTGLHNQLVIQSARLQQFKKEKNLGTTDFADLARNRIKISLALLDLADQLPKTAAEQKTKKLKGISERRFKRRVMALLIIGKVALFIFIFTIWQSGGLTFEGFLGTMGIVFPVFASYLSMGYQDMLSHRHEKVDTDKLRVSRGVHLSAYVFFGLYYAAIFLVLYLNTVGAIPNAVVEGQEGIPSYKNLFAMLALVESFIGVYIGKLIFSLFKKEL